MDDSLAESILRRLFVELEASARHVHLTDAQARTLFGHDLTPARPLSQPGQYLAEERIRLEGPKGSLDGVAVLGPARPEGQVELSATDVRTLGLSGVPVRLSGDTEGTPGMTVIGPRGRVTLPRGVLIARRHIHLTPEDAARFGVRHGQAVRLETFTDRPVVFDDVTVRVDPAFAPRVHLDFDEANACGFRPGDWGRIVP